MQLLPVPLKKRKISPGNGILKKHIAAMRLLSLTLLWILSILLLHTLYIMSMLCFVLITVEKSFTANALQAQELLSLAADKKVLLAEAIWTRYMPSRKIIADLLASGAIGRFTTLNATFSVPIHEIPRMHDPSLCGGALLDLGVYVLTTCILVTKL